MRSLSTIALCLAVGFVAVIATNAIADEKPAKPKPGTLPKSMLAPMEWRSIGPANMGGRITSLAIYEKDPSTWWAATASGGLLKTVDNGISFEHQFDKEAVVSIGDVAVAQSDPNIVWVGTGECNPRNSVSWGNGVHKSVDGGKTWKHMGLKHGFQTSSVRIHPTNPDVVYAGMLGRLWGPNEERGLFKTADGGKTWKKILYVDDKTGVIDVQMHPKDPDTLLVATYERQRDGFDTNDPAKKWGPGSGLHKTTDGGKTFTKITKGLPTGKLGRIGIEYYRKNPDVVFVVLESEMIGQEPPNAPYMGIRGADADVGARLTEVVKGGPAEKAGFKKEDVLIAVGEKTVHSYNELLRAIRQHVAGDKVKIEVSRERKSVFIELELGKRPPPKAPKGRKGPLPGKKKGPRRPFGTWLGGQRQNLQDQQGKQGHEYGGVYKSADGGDSWTRINSVNPRPMYFSEIRVDPNDENHIWVAGIRMWKSSDGGETFKGDGTPRGVHVDHHALWVDPADGRHLILGNDGGMYVSYDRGKHFDHLNHVAIGQFYDVGVGPRRDYRVYGGLQDNGSWGGPSRSRHASGPTNDDWIRVGGGDGFRVRVDANDPDLIYYESQNGATGRRHLVTGQRASTRPRPPRGTRYRFNWYTPFVLSHHNSRIYYVAGNKVFRSLDRGNRMRAISPDVTHTKRGSASALSESPRDENVLYVGTDDGGAWRTMDGGHTWTDLYTIGLELPKAPAAPKPTGKGPASSDGDGEADAREEDDKPKPADGDKPKAPTKPKPPDARPSDPKPADEEPAKAKSPKKGKGTISRRAEQLLRRMLRWDENADGSIQKSEVPERLAEMFERGDANGDGVIDRDEIIAMANRGGGRGGRGGTAQPSGTPADDEPAEKGKKKPAAKPAGPPLSKMQPDRRWVSWIEASRFAAGRVYLVFDGHRSDDDRAHLYVSEDHGTSWKSLRGDLPDSAGTTRVLREDLRNENVLYLGTEFGAWVSIDRGASWTSLNTNLPTVAVHQFAQHPTRGEIVAGTHGRSLWVLDVTTIRQMTKETLAAEVHLYKPNVAIQWRPQPSRGRSRSFVGKNPASGAQLLYSLAKKANDLKLEIRKQDGSVMRTLEAKADAGMHKVTWDLRGAPRRMRNGRMSRFGPRVQPGTYRAVLTVGEKSYTQDVVVEMDPNNADPAWMAHEDEAEELAAEKAAQKALRNRPADRDE